VGEIVRKKKSWKRERERERNEEKVGESEKKEELDEREEVEDVLEKEKDRQIEEQEEREKGGWKRQMLTRMKDLKMILRHFIPFHAASTSSDDASPIFAVSTYLLSPRLSVENHFADRHLVDPTNKLCVEKSFSCMNQTLCHRRVFKRRFHVLESKTFWLTDF
jgi:hypothetical protein